MARRQRITLYLVLILAGLAFLAVRWLTGPWRYRHTLAGQPEQEYYLYVPSGYTADKPWPLFVFVHGSGGDGTNCWDIWRKYAHLEQFVLLCPTFRDNTFRILGNDQDRALIDMVAQTGQQYRLMERFFLTGFSAGAQFTHRFVFRHPALLCGAAVHSAGSYDPPPADEARGVPFVVTVGALDSRRLDLGRWFAGELARKGYTATLAVIPQAGHQWTQEATDRTMALFNARCAAR